MPLFLVIEGKKDKSQPYQNQSAGIGNASKFKNCVEGNQCNYRLVDNLPGNAYPPDQKRRDDTLHINQ